MNKCALQWSIPSWSPQSGFWVGRVGWFRWATWLRLCPLEWAHLCYWSGSVAKTTEQVIVRSSNNVKLIKGKFFISSCSFRHSMSINHFIYNAERQVLSLTQRQSLKAVEKAEIIHFKFISCSYVMCDGRLTAANTLPYYLCNICVQTWKTVYVKARHLKDYIHCNLIWTIIMIHLFKMPYKCFSLKSKMFAKSEIHIKWLQLILAVCICSKRCALDLDGANRDITSKYSMRLLKYITVPVSTRHSLVKMHDTVIIRFSN